MLLLIGSCEYPRIFQVTGANQNARKLLSTDLVNTKCIYTSCNQRLGSTFYRICSVIMENWVAWKKQMENLIILMHSQQSQGTGIDVHENEAQSPREKGKH